MKNRIYSENGNYSVDHDGYVFRIITEKQAAVLVACGCVVTVLKNDDNVDEEIDIVDPIELCDYLKHDYKFGLPLDFVSDIVALDAKFDNK